MLSSKDVKPELMEKLRNFFEVQKEKKVLKTFKSIIYDLVYYEFPQSLCDMIGKLTQLDSEFFMTKIYPKLYTEIIEKWGISKSYAKFLNEMNLYILENYCLFEGEKIVCQFPAQVLPLRVGGWLYLTNFRMILIGLSVQVNMGPLAFLPRSMLLLLIGAGIKGAIDSQRKAIRDKIASTLSKDLSDFQTGEWGYTLPVVNAFDIKKTKKEFSYMIKFETETTEFKIQTGFNDPSLIYDQIESLLRKYQ